MKEIPIDAALLAEGGPVLASYSAHLIPEGRINRPFKLGVYEWVITATQRNKDRQAVKVWARKVLPSDAPEKPDSQLVYFGDRAYVIAEEIVLVPAPGSLKAPSEHRKPRRPRLRPGQGELF